MKVLLALVSLLTSLTAIAGQDRGGGSAVVCWDEKGAITTVTVLDLFEAKEKMAVTIDLGPAALTYQEKIKYVADRLQSVDALMAGRLRKGADEFAKNVAFLKRSMIPYIRDRGDYLRPKSCVTAQMAAHVLDPKPLEKKYMVDIELWSKANNDNKAALVMHEIIYEAVRRLGEETSQNTRYYVGVISAKEVSGFTPLQYYKMIGQMCWIDVDEGKAIWAQKGQCESVLGRDPVTVTDINEVVSVNYKGLPLMIKYIKFDENDRIEEGSMATKGTTKTPRGTIEVPANATVYFSGGRLWRISAILDPVTIYGKIYSSKDVLYFEFDKDGRLSIVPLKPRQQQQPDGWNLWPNGGN